MHTVVHPDVLSAILTSQAYDSHCNLVLGEVEETIYTIDEEEDGEENIKVGRASQPQSKIVRC